MDFGVANAVYFFFYTYQPPFPRLTEFSWAEDKVHTTQGQSRKFRLSVSGRGRRTIYAEIGFIAYSYPIASTTRRLTALRAGHQAAASAIPMAIGSATSTMVIGKRKGMVYPPTIVAAVRTKK